MSQTAIVILNYNGKKYLEKFLPSVLMHSKGHEIIVADNASTDDSIEYLTKHFPQVRVIVLTENHGFTGGYNRVLAQLEHEYFCLLNSDVEVSKGWIDTLVDYLNNHPQVAAVQPKILSHSKPEYFEYAGAGGGFIDSLGYPFCRGRLFHLTSKDDGQYNDSREVFWASGACMLIRSKVYNELGGLEEEFFAHMEEIDLCWRIQSAGLKVAYVGQSTVYHVGGGTLSHSNPRKTYLNFRNGLTLLYKNLPANKSWYIIPSRLILDGIAALKFLIVDKSLDNFKAVYRAHQDYFKNKSKFTEKRNSNRKNAKVTEIPTIYKGSIVYQVFIKGLKSTKSLKL